MNNQIWGVEKASKSIAGAIGRSCGMLMAIGLTISSMTLAAWLWRSSSVPGLIAILIPTAITFIIDVILVAYYDAVQFGKEMPNSMDKFMRAAIDEARKGLSEGGIPIGSVLVIDDRIVGHGHNQRVQSRSAILHAEMACFENAGRLRVREYERAILYSTLSPCDMCGGTSLLYKIPKIVIGENRTFNGPEEYLRSRGVELVILDDQDCIDIMTEFIKTRPELWNEDIGE